MINMAIGLLSNLKLLESFMHNAQEIAGKQSRYRCSLFHMGILHLYTLYFSVTFPFITTIFNSVHMVLS